MSRDHIESAHRTLWGVRVRCQPEASPKSFLTEQARWKAIELSLREARRCCPRSERGFYGSFADAYAFALSRVEYFKRLEVGADPAGEPFLFGDEGEDEYGD